ncbi:MAG: orotidine-5'-phosphate decarboxylase [Rhodospirillaceae bacterium]|nr:orotidine-5'-phosphate decarboxylase [Rhodospirillaceae bacterium]|tara:strand:- start:31340 stop:32047 length:708 start_codon:yes stop_codon:yes gene_type:complete
MGTLTPAERIFCAIDTTDLSAAIKLAQDLKGAVGGFKLGKEFFTANGPDGVARIAELGQRIFLDLKYHDIPNTVAGAVKAAKELDCFMLTIHASGGSAMVRAAAEAKGDTPSPKILAVTILTSLSADDLVQIGQKPPVADQVLRLGQLARTAGADGLVASSQEVTSLRAALGPDCLLVVPGIRPAWASTDDQKRIMTPADAVKAGADFLVIGRPITQADNPKAAANRISDEIAAG